MHITLFLKIDSATISMALGAGAEPTLALVARISDTSALLNDAAFNMASLPWNFRIKRGEPSSGDEYGQAQAIPHQGEHASIEATYAASPESFDRLEALVSKGMRSVVLGVTVAGVVKSHKEGTLQWASARDGAPILQVIVRAEYSKS